MQRIIKHADHKDIEEKIDGVWAVVKCNCELETKMRTFPKHHAPKMDYWHICEKDLTITAPLLNGKFYCPTCKAEVEVVKMTNDEYQTHLEQLKQAAEIEADNEWIADAEDSHADGLDLLRTQENARL